MPPLTIPDPSLVVLVGPAGSGKTTFAARHFAADEILSSDAMRAIVGRDESDQDATRPAFALLHRQLARRLRDGKLTVVDATNVEGHARRALLRRAAAAGLPAVAIVFDLPPHLVLQRNEGRQGRVVAGEVVRRHLAILRATINRGVIDGEGFHAVYRFRDPAELDALGIERSSAPG